MNRFRFPWQSRHSAAHLVWLGALVLLCGCAGQHPYLVPSQSVSDQFESGIAPAGYRFFTTGPVYRPEALLGIVPELAPPAGGPWRPAPEDPAQWRQLVRGMQFFDEEAWLMGSYGAILKLPDGRPVGIWYSARGLGTVTQDENGRLRVQPPVQRRPRLFRQDF